MVPFIRTGWNRLKDKPPGEAPGGLFSFSGDGNRAVALASLSCLDTGFVGASG